MNFVAFTIGILSGIFSGLIGLGGGIIMIPMMTLLLKFNQLEAQGTTLAAMIPPIGILAAYQYYKNGHVNIPIAVLLAVGFLLGGFIGAGVTEHLNINLIKKFFGFVMLIFSFRLIVYG